MKILYMLVLGIAATACSMKYTPKYYFNEIQVVNYSGATITNVSVRFESSAKTVKCDVVTKNRLCRDYFNKLRYPRQVIELAWTHGDGVEKSQQFNPRIPAYYHTPFPLRVMLEINEEGAVKTYFEQEEPDGRIFED
ncbi:MAG: hypothetical protein HKN34_06330 [Gammaproteobacteria bacterium]|nr:hypothetical protein [Gammaproteobacteria bacterium]